MQRTPKANLLSAHAIQPSPGQVWQALAVLGQQLQTLASAQMGEGAFYVQAAPALTLSQLFDEFIRAKTSAGRSERYLQTLGYSLEKFVTPRGAQSARSITVQEIEAWLDGQHVAARTKKGYIGDLRTLFSFAVKRRYLAHNPALAVELPVTVPGRVTVHTPGQAQAALDFALRTDKNICRALAIRYFAGLRTAEVERLSEYNILDGHIEVPADKSKTRRRRLVTIQPNLRLWLDMGGVLPAPRLTDRRMIEFIAKLKRETGIPWPHNVTRHSFASYHLARFENAGKTALECGHTEQMLFNHYREIVTPLAAAEFFSIVPRPAYPSIEPVTDLEE